MVTNTSLAVGALGLSGAGYIAYNYLTREDEPDYLRDNAVQRMIRAVAADRLKDALKSRPTDFSPQGVLAQAFYSPEKEVAKALLNECKAVMQEPGLMKDPAIQKIITEFEQRKEKDELAYYQTDTSRFTSKAEKNARSFLTAFAREGVLLGLPRGFNSRIHIVDPKKNGELKIFTTSKPWFFQKFFGKPVSDVEKVVTAQNLAKLIDQKKEMIQLLRLDTNGMSANLTKLQEKMTRNMDAPNAAKVQKALEPAFTKLAEIGKAIEDDKKGDWLPSFGDLAKKPFRAAWWATKNTAWFGGQAVKLSVKGTWSMVKTAASGTAQVAGFVAGVSFALITLPYNLMKSSS
jgi:hypothetical protein